MSNYSGKKSGLIQPVKLGKSVLLWPARGKDYTTGRRCVIIASATQSLINSPKLPNGVSVWLPALKGHFSSPLDFATFQGSETGARVTAQSQTQDYRLSKCGAVNYHAVQAADLIRDVVTIRLRKHHTAPTLYQLVAMLHNAGYTYKDIYCPLNSTLAPAAPQRPQNKDVARFAKDADPYDDYH